MRSKIASTTRAFSSPEGTLSGVASFNWYSRLRVGSRLRRVHRAVGGLPLDAALVDGGVRALGLAGAAVDAFAGDHCRHRVVLSRPAGERRKAGAAGAESAATG